MGSEEAANGQRRWRFRAPPRGQTPDQYLRCPAGDGDSCEHGEFCVRAHNAAELQEWVERFDPDHILSNIGRGLIQSRVEADWKVGAMLPSYAVLLVQPAAAVVKTHKAAPLTWRVAVTAGALPEALGLLDSAWRPCFRVVELRSPLLPQPLAVDAREWTCTDRVLLDRSSAAGGPVSFEVTVSFTADVYGRYQQRLALIFPHHAPMLCYLQADVVPRATIRAVEELRGQLTVSAAGWSDDDVQVVPFSPDPSPADAQEQALLAAFPAPGGDLAAPEAALLTADNYAALAGGLLQLEEAARAALLHKFNVTSELRLVDHYVLASDGGRHHARTGELFARLCTQLELSADTAAGRLILETCQRALLAPTAQNSGEEEKRKVYEVLIVAKAKREIFFRLPAEMVKELSLSGGGWLRAAIRFQSSRQPFCEMQEGVRLAAERASRLLFPDTVERPTIPWNPASHWRPEDDMLNPKQKEAINAMTVATSRPLPPVLILGPYGTGKTFTMAHGVKHILTNRSDARILICTHSNSAADLYIRHYLPEYVEAGLESARPLRVYYKQRRLGTVHPVVRPFSLLEENRGDSDVTFRLPTVDDVMKHRVIVATLSITKYLTWLDLPADTFTHILVDEAAQALEWEVARVLSLAGPETRLVLAGDHLQLAPEVYSDVCRERNFQRSLLERLQARYGADFPCSVTLHDNYRSHADIVKLTSEMFYGRRLRSRGHPGRHSSLPPVTFFSARGEAKQALSSTGYCNDAEVYEVADQVAALWEDWPSEWGDRNESGVCVVSAYAEQVQKIRSELRNRRLGSVTVERLQNVQGKEFRAVLVSTVRTRETCTDPAGDYGFMSDCKLLNTAITRARSLLAVVGCPEALCSVGSCARYWEAYVRAAAEAGGLFGTTLTELRSQLDAAELRSLHGLNPLAPTFRPQVPPPPQPPPQQQLQPQQALLPWPPQPPRYLHMPYLGALAPGCLMGRPLMVRPFPLIQQPLLPCQPGFVRPATLANGVPPWAGHRPAHPPARSDALSGANSESVLEQLSTTDLVSLLPPDVKLQQLLGDTRLQQEWATQLAARRGPAAAEQFRALLASFRDVSGVPADRPASAASPAAATAKAASPKAASPSPTPAARAATKLTAPAARAAKLTAPAAQPAAKAGSPSPPPYPPPPPPVAEQLDRILQEAPPSPEPAWARPATPGGAVPAGQAEAAASAAADRADTQTEPAAAPSQTSSQRGDQSLPLYLRGCAPASPPSGERRSYAAAVRRSLDPLPAGLAALPRREHHVHGYSHF